MSNPTDQLEAPRRALFDAATDFRESTNLEDGQKLCAAAVAYTRARDKLKPAAQPGTGQVSQYPGRTLVPFGRRQGDMLDDCEPNELRWLRERVELGLLDPTRARYRAKNEALIADITAVLRRDGHE